MDQTSALGLMALIIRSATIPRGRFGNEVWTATAIRWNGAVTSPTATRANERWSMDFVSDCVSTGKVIRMLTIVDECTRECPAIEVDTSLGGLRVRGVLDRIASERGLPEAIVVDNGPEFRGQALAAWSEERRVRLEFIQPGQARAAEQIQLSCRFTRTKLSLCVLTTTATDCSQIHLMTERALQCCRLSAEIYRFASPVV